MAQSQPAPFGLFTAMMVAQPFVALFVFLETKGVALERMQKKPGIHESSERAISRPTPMAPRAANGDESGPADVGQTSVCRPASAGLSDESCVR